MLIGELDIAVADGVETRLRAHRADGNPVRLDLSQLDFIDSSGVRAIVLGLKHARSGGVELDVDTRVSSTVARMIEIMGIGSQLWPARPSRRRSRTEPWARAAGRRRSRYA